MKERLSENQIKKIPVPWRLYIEIGFIALLVVGAMWYLLQQTKSISALHDSLLMNVSGIELKVTTSHLWFEEILSGDSTESIEAVWELLDQAERHLQALAGKVLDSGEHVRPDVAVDTREDIGLFHLYHESHIIPYIKESTELVAEKLIQCRKIFEKRYNAIQTSGPGTEIDQRFDQVFIELLKGISEIKNKIQDSKANHLAEYRIIQTSLIYICLGLAVLSAVILHLFERRIAKDLLAVMRNREALLLSQKRLKSVKEIGSLASSTLSLESVFQSILSGTLEAANASVGEIFLKDPDTGCLSWGASTGLSEAFVKEYKHQHIQPGEGLTGRIAQTGEPIYISADASHDPRIARPVVMEEGLNSFVGVPIYAADEIIGVMNILTRSPDILSEEDITLVAAIGAHIGPAIRNAQLFGQLKKAGEAFRDSEKKYRLLVKNIPSIVYKGFKDWSVEFFDKKIEQLTGYDADEFNSNRMKWINIIVEEDIENARVSFIQALKTDKSYVREYRIRSKTGNIHWIQERGQIVCDSKGELEYVSGIFFDITERKQAQQSILQAKEDWERTFNSLPDLIAIIDDNHQIIRVNKAMANKLGVTPDEAIGLKCYEHVHGTEEPPPYCPHAKLLTNDCEHSVEVYEEKLGGDFLIAVSPLHGPDDRLIGCVHVARDITERKQAEKEKAKLHDQLQQAQKMESIGTLAGGIAHDFNNVLYSIIGYTELTMDDMPEGSLAQKNLKEVFKGAMRAKDMVRQILAFSRKAQNETYC